MYLSFHWLRKLASKKILQKNTFNHSINNTNSVLQLCAAIKIETRTSHQCFRASHNVLGYEVTHLYQNPDAFFSTTRQYLLADLGYGIFNILVLLIKRPSRPR